MKAQAAMLAVLLVGFAEIAGASDTGRFAVAVCVDGDIDPNIAGHAQPQASRSFRRIGVRLDWHPANSGFCGRGGPSVIRVTYSRHAPIDVAPSALAYALPYEGVHIAVFYERLPGNDEAQSAEVLGYVLVHEITHILQGVARHSDSGIMKAQWDKTDYARMKLVPMSFAEEDVNLIRKSSQVRANRAAAGTPLAVSVTSLTALGSSNINGLSSKK
jgi:hypothetical protein